jgi:hypothetical protein
MAKEIIEGKVVDNPPDLMVPVVGEGVSVELDKLRDAILAQEAEAPPVETPPAEKPPVETPPAEKPPVETPPAEKPPVETPPAEKPPVETPPAEIPPADPFTAKLDAVEIPPHARPKSAEAFAQVKGIAKQEVAQLRSELEAERKAKLAAEELAKQTISKEEFEKLQSEAAELRKFKLSKDIESDPRLQTFDKQIVDNDEAIMAKFAEVGGKPEQIAEIKKLGGPRKIDWEPLFKHMTIPQRRFIESKLVESEGVAYNRTKAMEAAKSDVDAWQKEYDQRRHKTAEAEISKAEWLKPVEAPPTATVNEKTQATAHNLRISNLKARIASAISDTTPEMHATLAVGTALAHDLHWQLSQLVALREREKTESVSERTKAVEALTKERDTLKAELDKIKNASRGARPGSVASGRASAKLPNSGTPDLSRSTGDVLDDLVREALAGQS